eukprot:gnl/MRDRNA2_/MRDRNA2_79513_c0_seq2.p1 gnl/MRDRNA2_/MRDRNA2_79513_c0~~gnl/MRDRNA2_/MRDRNA2_79513_c0_seq2.p1  ORF type:complete len:292 (+),score=41.04 gnl/MRDRNA2_/MRDRNA2_79513_c0_seq2:214-1089(+)
MASINNELKKACEKGDLAEATRILNKMGQQGPNVEFVFQQTPLYYAAWKGHLKIAELLVQKKAKIDHLDKAKNTPLVYAVSCGHFPVVQFLVEKGANPHAVDAMGQSILDYAKKSKKKEIVDYITQKIAIDSTTMVEKQGGDKIGEPQNNEDHSAKTDIEDPVIKAVLDKFHEEDCFSDELKTFALKHCGVFEDVGEHKLEYTIIYNEFQKEFESRFEVLVKNAANMSIEEFQLLLLVQQRMGQTRTNNDDESHSGNIVVSFIDVILAITDYQQFVDWMLDAKQEHAESLE